VSKNVLVSLLLSSNMWFLQTTLNRLSSNASGNVVTVSILSLYYMIGLAVFIVSDNKVIPCTAVSQVSWT